jgi:large subunit ribosomal protein L9
MRVIFLRDVPRAGKRHDVKEVNDGYAVNFLFPKKLAEPATPRTLADLEKRKKEIIVEKKIQEELLDRSLAEIKDKTIHLQGKANERGHLFSAIHKKEIVEALASELRATIGEEFIILNKPIKELGEFEILVEIKNKKSSFKLVVEKE